MGVPNFFSWLIKRYPMSLYDIDEVFYGNYNKNLDSYTLNMNQVIYKCATNPNVLFKDQLRQQDFDVVWANIYNYLNMIIDIARPQQLLFMAFDGTAPRAKMNQQRQRRFQSAKRNSELDGQLASLGQGNCNETFKNNQISAGTEFMDKLNKQIRFFIERKFFESPIFQKLQVIFSGSDIPGEGEHKILEYIRNIQRLPNFCPNWTYMIYGADADLIILGLSTQLKNFTLIREKMPPFKKEKITVAAQRHPEQLGFQIINLQIVHEYLDLEYRNVKMKIPYKIERVIDDFIMLLCLVGNDFLPRIFCFDIKQGTFELLILLFKEQLSECKDYLTNRGSINWTEMLRLTKRLEGFEIVAMEKRKQELEEFIKTQKVDLNQLLKKEMQMLTQLQEYYQKNEHSIAKQQFYREKCKIDFTNNLEEIKKMAQCYLEGIQFVLQYYYVKLPSWDWHYTFYYAPLCSELHLYILEQRDLTYQMTKSLQLNSQHIFTISEPYPPFKQLLCILSSLNANLLPLPYRGLLQDTNSPLREPIDYYPLEFEIDPFGAVWEHQFIAKLPFLNKALIDKTYQSIDHQELSQEERDRNQIGQTLLFSYNFEQEQKIKSILPSIFDDFEVKLKTEKFNFGSLEDCLALSQRFASKNCQIPRVPSLYIKDIKSSFLKDLKHRENKSKQVAIEYKEPQVWLLRDNKITEQYVYCGQPIQELCEVLAVLNVKQIFFGVNVFIQDIRTLCDFDYRLNRHADGFYDLLSNVREGLNNKGIYDGGEITTIVIVQQLSKPIRKSNGTIKYIGGEELIMPFSCVSREKKWDMKEFNLRLQHLHLEFSQEQKVAIFVPTQFDQAKLLNGCICKVESLIPANNKVVMQTTKFPQKLAQKPDFYSRYYTIDYVAQKLDEPLDVVLFVLGSVKIVFETEIVDGVDVGLNIINMQSNSLVPNLARMPEAQEMVNLLFKQINKRTGIKKISNECVSIIVQYKNKFPQLFKFLNEVGNLKGLFVIKVHEVLKETEEPQKFLFQIYIWILQLKTSHLFLCKSVSSMIESQEIEKLSKVPTEQIKQKNYSMLADPGFLVKENYDFYIPPFFLEHPQHHQLRNRVVNLNATSSKHPRFGSTGTVIGIIDMDEVLIEVLWDEAQIGLTDLGGRCPIFRGSLVKFTDVFNLSLPWSDLLCDSSNNIEGWNHKTTIFSPIFRQRAIDNDQIQQKIQKSEKIKDPFSDLDKKGKQNKNQVEEIRPKENEKKQRKKLQRVKTPKQKQNSNEYPDEEYGALSMYQEKQISEENQGSPQKQEVHIQKNESKEGVK